MRSISIIIKKHGAPLYHCGLVHLALAILFLVCMLFDHRQLMDQNVWIKPFKFAVSIAIYSLTWPLLLQFLPDSGLLRRFVRFTVFALAFEMIAIATQAARGELSHFNQDGAYNIILYALMGLVITAQTVFAVVIAVQFFRIDAQRLSPGLLWSIRLGILIACIFAAQGGLMGQRMAHSVGAPDGGSGIALLGWSRTAGDLRIAHFFGLHALQILPLFALAFKVGKAAPAIVFALLYFAFTSLVFYGALLGSPLFG
jgi:hypothetical protein